MISKTINGFTVSWELLSGLILLPRAFFGDCFDNEVPSRVFSLEKFTGTETNYAKTFGEFDRFCKFFDLSTK